MADINTDLATSSGITHLVESLGPWMVFALITIVGFFILAFKHGGLLTHYLQARGNSDKKLIEGLETQVKDIQTENKLLRKELDEERGRTRALQEQLTNALVTIGEQRGLIASLQTTIRGQTERMSGLMQAFKVARGSS